ncbi:MAG: hypothetical protein Q9225_004080 [Loekoesia sp. 1 TL-2023]
MALHERQICVPYKPRNLEPTRVEGFRKTDASNLPRYHFGRMTSNSRYTAIGLRWASSFHGKGETAFGVEVQWHSTPRTQRGEMDSCSITLFPRPNPRSTAIFAVAKAHNLPLKIIYADKDDPEAHAALCEINPLGQVPTFVGSDGHVLTECIPTALYCSTRRDYYDIIKWMSFSNSDMLPCIGACILPLIGRQQVVRQNGEDSLRALHKHWTIFDNHLKTHQYLVGNDFTIADFFVVGLLGGAFRVFHKILHAEYKAMTRWFYEVYNIPMYKDVAGEIQLMDLPVPTLPPNERDSAVEKGAQMPLNSSIEKHGEMQEVATAAA